MNGFEAPCERFALAPPIEVQINSVSNNREPVGRNVVMRRDTSPAAADTAPCGVSARRDSITKRRFQPGPDAFHARVWTTTGTPASVPPASDDVGRCVMRCKHPGANRPAACQGCNFPPGFPFRDVHRFSGNSTIRNAALVPDLARQQHTRCKFIGWQTGLGRKRLSPTPRCLKPDEMHDTHWLARG